jgi:HPt (histidine-containing phosphotransfer) domain-containing protein
MENQLTNLSYLKATCGDSNDMMNSIITMFLDTTPPILADMHLNIASKNWELLKRNAHKAKSSFMMMGAKSTGEKLEEIELNSTEEESPNLIRLLTNIETECTVVFEELRKAI